MGRLGGNLPSTSVRQYQRKANPLERALTALQTPNFAMAGLGNAIVAGENPLESMHRYISEHKTFSDVLIDNQIVDGTTAHLAGFAADLVLDPTTYLGFGEMTKAGKILESAHLGAAFAMLEGDLGKAAKASVELAEAGEKYGKMPKRSMVSFAGKPVIYGERVMQAVDRQLTRVGDSSVGRAFNTVFRTAQARAPLPAKLRNIVRRSETAKVVTRLASDIGEHGSAYYNEMRGLGIDTESARDILRDTIEKMGVNPATTDYRAFMDAPTRALHDEARNIGNMMFADSPEDVNEAWDGIGRMPTAMRQWLEDNGRHDTLEMLRGIETDAHNTASELALMDSIKLVKKHYGHEFTSSIDTPLRAAVNYVNTINMHYARMERSTGLKLTDLASDINYLKHALTPEGAAAIAESSGLHKQLNRAPTSYEISVHFSGQLQRDAALRNKTISEINELAEQGLLHSVLGRRKVKLFDDEPFHAAFVRGVEGTKAIESAKMLRDVGAQYGVKIGNGTDAIRSADIPAGYRQVSHRLMEDMGMEVPDMIDGNVVKDPFRIRNERGELVQDLAFPHDIADLLESSYERVITPRQLQPILRAYDKITSMWKNINLPIWPAYHTRNLMSDLMLITHGADDMGITPMEALIGFKDAALGLTGKMETIDLGSHGKMAWADFQRDFLEHFGIKDLSPARDLDDVIARPNKLPRFGSKLDRAAAWLESSAPVEKGIRAGLWRQNATNAAYYIQLLRRGVSPEMAALEVKKRLFDFGDLTDIERQVLRRFLPFYSWLRHNLPYQIHAAVKKPRTLTIIPKVREVFTGGEGPAGDVPLPKFIQDALPMQLSGGDENTRLFMRLQNLVPQGDLSIFNDPVGYAQQSINPLLKVPAEIATNYDPWQKEDVERFPGEMTSRLGLPIPKRYVAPIVDTIRPLNEANNLFFRDVPLSGKLESLAYARAYEVDRAKQFRIMSMRLEEERQKAKSLLYKAAAKGDKANMAQIRNYIRQLYDNPVQVMR